MISESLKLNLTC